jgi:hypothetical protein
MMQSKIIDSQKKERNSMNLNDYLERSIDLVNEFDDHSGILANKVNQNSASSKKNASICLKIDKNHLPVSPESYLKKWGSDIKRKGAHQRRISEYFSNYYF